MKENKKKFNWKKAGTVVVLVATATGSFLLGVLAGKSNPEKVLELENKLLERELTAARNQVADLTRDFTRRVGDLSYRHGKLADRYAIEKEKNRL